MVMKILITGGAGYVGSTLAPMLLSAGHRVRVLDRLLYGGQGLSALGGREGFSLIEGDVRDLETLKRAADDCDAIVHLAAIVGLARAR